MTERDELRAAKALQGASFPATKDELLDYARTRAVDQKSLQALAALPSGRFESMDDVTASVPQEPEGEDRPGGTAR